LGLPPSSAVVPLLEPDVVIVPDAAAASSPVDAPPLLMTPLIAPLDAMPPVAEPDELPLAEPGSAPVLTPDPPTDPDEPDDAPTMDPEAEPLSPEDPEPTVIEGVFELEHARLVVIPMQNNPKRHPADMETSATQACLVKTGGRSQRPPNTRIIKYQAWERAR